MSTEAFHGRFRDIGEFQPDGPSGDLVLNRNLKPLKPQNLLMGIVAITTLTEPIWGSLMMKSGGVVDLNDFNHPITPLAGEIPSSPTPNPKGPFRLDQAAKITTRLTANGQLEMVELVNPGEKGYFVPTGPCRYCGDVIGYRTVHIPEGTPIEIWDGFKMITVPAPPGTVQYYPLDVTPTPITFQK